MHVCAYVDPTARESEEYEEIGRLLRDGLGWGCTIERGVKPQDMLQKPADVYVVDVGGMCVAGYGDGGLSVYRAIIEVVGERPSLLVLLWSSFTGWGYWQVAKGSFPDLAERGLLRREREVVIHHEVR
jgi:hypothetical protein